MSSSPLAALQNYAATLDPSQLPPNLLLKYTESAITIFDTYPKAMFHFLVMPRITDKPPDPSMTKSNLKDLTSLLKLEKEVALACLKELEREADDVRRMIEDEQIKKHGVKWDVNIGFHAVPSMYHVHLHVISSDLISPSLKNKKHYNSFNPKLGFFIDLQDVLSWFELPEESFKKKAALPAKEYEPLLKTPLECWKCDESQSNMPKLKTHLQKHFDIEIKKKAAKRKRTSDQEDVVEPPAKK